MEKREPSENKVLKIWSFEPQKNQESDYVRTFKDFFAGTISGMSGVLVGHPFDTIKVFVSNWLFYR